VEKGKKEKEERLYKMKVCEIEWSNYLN